VQINRGAAEKSSTIDFSAKVRLAANLSIPQAWGLAVQRHPAGFEAIKYVSRFVDQPCLALFDRGGLQSKLRVTELGALSDLDTPVDWLHERKAALE